MIIDPSSPLAQADFVPFLTDLLIGAGKITLASFRKPLKFHLKSNEQGHVTEADFASEKFLVESIGRKFKNHNILSEEAGALDRIKRADSYIWIMDPLDGTRNYLQGNSYYCISVALGKIDAKNDLNCEIIAGGIYHPINGDLYLALRGKGAFVNGVQMHISKKKEIAGSSFATGFSYSKGPELKQIVDSIYAVQKFQGSAVRLNGAAALDIALTARGVFDGFWEKNLSVWDMAAGTVIIEEAGGICSNFLGEKFNPLVDKNIICANPILHRELVEILRPIFNSESTVES